MRRLLCAIIKFAAVLWALPILEPIEAKGQDRPASAASNAGSQPTLLFDGTSLAGWQTAEGLPPGEGWTVEDGAIHRRFRTGHIYYPELFEDFELRFEWKIAPGGNSGIKYRVARYGDRLLGCEYQMIDDERLKDRLSPTQLTGALYGLYAAKETKRLRPVGEYNEGRIVVQGNRIEHWLNGEKVVDVDTTSDDWRRRVVDSKFAEYEGFGENRRGWIMLQDHGSPVWFRKLVIRRLPPGPLNVVLIISDDQAWSDYGFMGHPLIETPHLDRLARESLLFRRGYVPSSLCAPSLATIITGLYPHQHTITGNDPPEPPGVRNPRRDSGYLAEDARMDARIAQAQTLPRILAAQGYLSFQSGKWWHGSYREGGFTHGMTHGDPARGGRHGDEGLAIGREGLEPIRQFLSEARSQRRPFFLWYAPMMPHTPHTPPERLLQKYLPRTDSPFVARYHAMCEWFDETCGALLDMLEPQKENTLVVFVADNGWINRQDQSAYAPRSKRSPYEGGIRTPIMVRLPRAVVPTVVDTPVSSIDIVPTVLAACGLPIPDTLAGINLLDPERVAARRAVFGAVYHHTAVDIDRPERNLLFRWVVSDPWKLIVPDETNSPGTPLELFEVSHDPHEMTNVAAQRQAELKRLQQLLDAWWNAGGS
jgi:uncharacterized sulfatase